MFRGNWYDLYVFLYESLRTGTSQTHSSKTSSRRPRKHQFRLKKSDTACQIYRQNHHDVREYLASLSVCERDKCEQSPNSRTLGQAYNLHSMLIHQCNSGPTVQQTSDAMIIRLEPRYQNQQIQNTETLLNYIACRLKILDISSFCMCLSASVSHSATTCPLSDLMSK